MCIAINHGLTVRAAEEGGRIPAMTVLPDDFVAGLEGVVAFTTEIAEPDRDGGALRYRGVDIEDLVGHRVTFGDVWALLVDGRFGDGLAPAEPFPLPIHTGDVRVDVQAGLAMLAPIWGYAPLLDIDDGTARAQLARASVMAAALEGWALAYLPPGINMEIFSPYSECKSLHIDTKEHTTHVSAIVHKSKNTERDKSKCTQ